MTRPPASLKPEMSMPTCLAQLVPATSPGRTSTKLVPAYASPKGRERERLHLVLDPQRERGRRLAGELFDADLGAANTIQTHRIDPTASVFDTAVRNRSRLDMRLAQDRSAQLRVAPQRGKAEVHKPAWRLVE